MNSEIYQEILSELNFMFVDGKRMSEEIELICSQVQLPEVGPEFGDDFGYTIREREENRLRQVIKDFYSKNDYDKYMQSLCAMNKMIYCYYELVSHHEGINFRTISEIDFLKILKTPDKQIEKLNILNYDYEMDLKYIRYFLENTKYDINYN